MQNLTSLLATWRSHLDASGGFTPSQLAELESHLLDAIDQLQSSGLAPDEAFLIAQRRLGESDMLFAEFAKAHPNQRTHRALLWILTGAFGFFLLNLCLSAASAFATWITIPHIGVMGGSLAGQGIRLSVIALVLVLIWRASTGRRVNVFATFARIKRLKPVHLIGFALGVFLVAGLARVLMTQAIYRHMAGPEETIAFSLNFGIQTVTTLALLIVLPLMIHRLRRQHASI